MSPTLIRKIWNIVDQSVAESLVSLSDTALVQHLSARMTSIYLLSPEELLLVRQYVGQKSCLIRDYCMQG